MLHLHFRLSVIKTIFNGFGYAAKALPGILNEFLSIDE